MADTPQPPPPPGVPGAPVTPMKNPQARSSLKRKPSGLLYPPSLPQHRPSSCRRCLLAAPQARPVASLQALPLPRRALPALRQLPHNAPQRLPRWPLQVFLTLLLLQPQLPPARLRRLFNAPRPQPLPRKSARSTPSWPSPPALPQWPLLAPRFG